MIHRRLYEWLLLSLPYMITSMLILCDAQGSGVLVMDKAGPIGKGAYGQVYQAWDHGRGSVRIAVKRIRLRGSFTMQELTLATLEEELALMYKLRGQTKGQTTHICFPENHGEGGRVSDMVGPLCRCTGL